MTTSTASAASTGPATGQERGRRARRAARPGDSSRSTCSAGISPPHSPTAGVRRAGRRAGAGGRRPHRARGPRGALAARLLHPARRPRRPDRLRGRAACATAARSPRAGCSRSSTARRSSRCRRRSSCRRRAWSTRSQPAEGVPDAGHAARARRARLVGGRAAGSPGPRPLDIRFVDDPPPWSDELAGATEEPARVWMRADGGLPDDRAAARLPAHLRQRPHAARLGAGPPRPRRGAGADGEPRPRHVVPPPVPRRRVAALHVLLAERGRRRGAWRPAASPRPTAAGGLHRAGGPGQGSGMILCHAG